MKCLVVFDQTITGRNGSSDFYRMAMGQLHAFNIGVGRMTIEVLEARGVAGLEDTYDFILCPQYGGGANNIINDVALNLPIVLLGATAGTSQFGDNSGISGAHSGNQTLFMDVPFTSIPWITMAARSYAAGTGTIHVSVSAIDPLTDAAQTNAGKTALWSSEMAGGHKFYACGIDGTDNPMLGLILQIMLNDSELSGSPNRIAPIVVDCDHINGLYTHDEPALLDYLASRIPAGGVTWGGQQNISEDYFENMAEAVSARLLKHQAKIPICYHIHRAGEQPNSGSWPNFTQEQTKAEQEAVYVTDKATIEGHGLSYQTPAYYNAGANNWDEDTIALFSDTTQVGKGFRAFRAGSNRLNTRVYGLAANQKHNQHYQRRMMRGIQFFFTKDLALNTSMPYDTAADWRVPFRDLMNAHNMGTTIFIHDEDLLSADQDPSVSGKQQGYAMLDMVTGYGEYCKDVCNYYVDPVDYVMPRHSQGVNGVQY